MSEPDLDSLSTVRRNLLTQDGYSPYCGDEMCRFHWPRTHFDGEQFRCGCGWRSELEPEFVTQFLARWPERARITADPTVLGEGR